MKILLSKKVAVLLGFFALSLTAGSTFAGQKEQCAGADTSAECTGLIKVEMSGKPLPKPNFIHLCQWVEDACKPADANKKK